MLKEGDIIFFKVIKTIVLPDKSEAFIMESPSGSRHILDKRYYKNYPIKIGGNIQCKIDKINCNGELFLEPHNPFYDVGKSYFFDVIEKAIINNTLGDEIQALRVHDYFQNIYTVAYEYDDNNIPEKVKLIVYRIKKGNLYLRSHSARPYLKKGEVYSFKINELFKTPSGIVCYILLDQWGLKHSLEKKFYENYNLKIGDELFCEVSKSLPNSEYGLEPVHPFYKTGAIYELQFLNYKTETTHFGIPKKIMTGLDSYGQFVRIYESHEQKIPDNLISGTRVHGKLVKIIQGNPIFHYITLA